MSNPNDVSWFDSAKSKVSKILFGDKKPEEAGPFTDFSLMATGTDRVSTFQGVASYPIDILSENSEVDRAVKFSAYDYTSERSNPNTRRELDSRDTHIWNCFLPITSITDSEKHKYDPYDGAGTGVGVDKIANSIRKGDVMGVMSGAGDALLGAGVKGAMHLAKSKMKNEFNMLRRTGLDGKSIDPLNSLMYEGSGLRQFDFSWQMVARNQAESYQILAIIQSFKALSRPTTTNAWGLSYPFLSHPCLWQIEFVDARTKDGANAAHFLPRIQTCVLEDISVSYQGENSSSPIFFRDTSAPVEISLSLSFTEMFQMINGAPLVTANKGK